MAGHRQEQGALDELIRDPIVRLTMRADAVDEQELRALLRRIGWRLGEAGARGGDAAAATGERRGYRRGVGVMLLNERNEVLVGRRIDTPGEAWQMPQGGIDPGEDPAAAAMRELREEIGTDKAEILAESDGWLRYDLPDQLAARTWGGRWRGQMQKWFVMRFKGTDADIDVATEHPEFSAWRWVPAAELPAIAVAFKRQLYLDLLARVAARHLEPPR